MRRLTLALVLLAATTLAAQTPSRQPDWAKVDEETMRHFQAILRMDTTDPPGGEKPVVDYLKQHARGRRHPGADAGDARPRRTGRIWWPASRAAASCGRCCSWDTPTRSTSTRRNGRFPPFAATRDGGYVYGRGTVDDKDNVVANLMTMLLLKRLNVALDRDVIFLAEAGEEGASTLGVQFVANEHFPLIDAEYCFAEGGNVTRTGGAVKFASVQTRREDSPRHHGHGTRHLGPRLGAARDQRGLAPVGGRRPRRRVDAADAAQRDHGRVLQAAGHCLHARGSGTVPRRC